MKRRGGIRKKGESNTGGATASSSTTTRKSVGFAPSATPLPSSKAKDVVAAAVEKTVPISALKASTLPHSLRRHHAVCQFVHSLFSPVQQQAATPMTLEDGEVVVDHTNGPPLLLASFVADPYSKLPSSATEDGDFQKHTGPSSPSSSSLALWTLSAHLSSKSYNGMLAALDVALCAHMQPSFQIRDTCRVRVLQEASATFCASLPMVPDASVDLGTVAGLRHGIVLLLALVLPCRRWGSNGGEDWLMWGLTFPRLGRSHTQLPREAAQVAAACCDVNANGWLAQSALLWSKTLTSLEAATGAAPLHATASSHSIASPLQSSQWLDVPTGGLTSGSPNIDKWRLAEASATSRTLGAFTPLILTGATFHSQLHLAATRNVRPDTPSRHRLSSSFPSTADTLQSGHEPSIQYLLGLLKRIVANWELDETATTKSNPPCGNNKSKRGVIGGAEGAIVNLVRGDGSSALLLSTSTPCLPISSRSALGTKRDREGAVKIEEEGEVGCGVVSSSSSSSSRRDLMELLVVAMQEGEGIPPYMRYIQRLSKDATAASSSIPIAATPTAVDDDQSRKFSSPAAAVGVFDVESVFPTLADLPASIVTPSLWGAAPGGGPSPADVLRGYGSKVQLEINEEFLAHIAAPRAFLLSSSTEPEGRVTTTPQHHHHRGPPWIFPVVLWALDGPSMTVLLRQWVAGNEDGCTASNPLHVLCSYICKHLFEGTPKTDEYSVKLGAAIEHRVERAQEGRRNCCSVVVDHALVHLLQGGEDDVFGSILQAAIRLKGDVTQSARDASHGLLVWCYGGFEGMEASCYFPACAFTCLQ